MLIIILLIHFHSLIPGNNPKLNENQKTTKLTLLFHYFLFQHNGVEYIGRVGSNNIPYMPHIIQSIHNREHYISIK